MISLHSFQSPASASSLCDPILSSLSTPPLAPAHKNRGRFYYTGEMTLRHRVPHFQGFSEVSLDCIFMSPEESLQHMDLLQMPGPPQNHIHHHSSHSAWSTAYLPCMCIARTPGPYMKLARWHFNFVNMHLVFFREESGLQRNPTETTTES